MKSVQKIDLGLTGYDELFMNDAERKENKLPRIYDIPLSEIDDFPDHPFKVKIDEDIQFALAGVEVNLLMAGICLILAMQSYQWSRTMFSVANVNVILAGVNLLPASGLDGESALSAACGINSISEVARKWLTNKKCRKKLLRAGLPGYACFCFFSVTMISKVILWLLIGLDVVLVFFNIF